MRFSSTTFLPKSSGGGFLHIRTLVFVCSSSCFCVSVCAGMLPPSRPVFVWSSSSSSSFNCVQNCVSCVCACVFVCLCVSCLCIVSQTLYPSPTRLQSVKMLKVLTAPKICGGRGYPDVNQIFCIIPRLNWCEFPIRWISLCQRTFNGSVVSTCGDYNYNWSTIGQERRKTNIDEGNQKIQKSCFIQKTLMWVCIFYLSWFRSRLAEVSF